MFSLKKAFFIFADQLGCVIKVFYILSFVSFWVVAGPANEIFNGQVFFFFHCLPVKQAINFKRFKIVSVIVNKHEEGLMRTKLLKEVFGQLKHGFQLRY